MYEELSEVVDLYKKIEERLSHPDTMKNQELFQKMSKNHARLQPIVETYTELTSSRTQFEENKELIQGSDPDLKEMAEEDNKELEKKIEELSETLKRLLLPVDPNDDRNILIEIRPAAGGDEAGLFAGDLYKMYMKYAEINAWRVEPMSISDNSVGGYKEVILMIRGEKVYSKLKYESGVHRVQRVPKTETQGRVHTSTVTVAVLPEAEDVEIGIDQNELRIDVFRSSGPGGQSVNTTDSAVRITHLPTNLVVTCQDEKSQHKNKAKALKILKTRLMDIKQKEAQQERAEARLSQVGTGDRSEKIRTYNYPQGRITDHRIGITVYDLENFLLGNIEKMMSALIAFDETEKLKTQTVESSLKDILDVQKDIS